MISRGGFELNEIWHRQSSAILLQENLNALHKHWQETGATEARDAWHSAMKKAGLGHEAARVIMAPHVAEFRQRRKDLMSVIGRGMQSPFSTPKRTEADNRNVAQVRHDYDQSQRSLARTSAEIGHPHEHGHFIPPLKDQHPLDHVDELAHAYGQPVTPRHLPQFKQREQHAGAETTVNRLPHHEAARGFESAVDHHHKDRIIREPDLEKFAPEQSRPIKTTLRDKAWEHAQRLKGGHDSDTADDDDGDDDGDEWKR